MDESEHLTEAQAAAMIGWTAANLRSHRLRHEAERIAAALSPDAQTLVQAVRRHGLDTEVVLDGYHGPALFRRVGERWGLTQAGLEVARRIGKVSRRSPAPPPAEVSAGHIRYRRDEVQRWLEQHPEVAQRSRRRESTWGYGETAAELGIALGTLRTLVSRAQVAQRRLDDGDRDPGGALARQVDRCPPWTWAGAERRWLPADVRQWADRRQPGPDPLATKPQRGRGPLISEAEAQALMAVETATLIGYRARARAALRRLARRRRPGPAVDRDVRRARAHPPYVLRDGQRLYHRQDVLDWVERRGKRAA